jgi:hypothetical protein
MEKRPINILALIRITVNGIMILKKLSNLYKWSPVHFVSLVCSGLVVDRIERVEEPAKTICTVVLESTLELLANT